MRKEIFKRENGSVGVRYVFEKPSKTDQSQKADCDPNVIMARYRKTKIWPGDPARAQQYADVSEIPDLMGAYEQIRLAEDAFSALPSEVRARFANSPVELYNFLQDPRNIDEAVKLGLAIARPEEPSPVPKETGGDKAKPRQSSKKQPELPLEEE